MIIGSWPVGNTSGPWLKFNRGLTWIVVDRRVIVYAELKTDTLGPDYKS